jgi:hypothetical protein
VREKRVNRLSQEFAGQRSTSVRDDKSNIQIVRSHLDRSKKVFMREVRDDRAILNAELGPQLAAKLLQERTATRQEDHVQATRRYLSRECCPDTGRGSGDDRPGTEARRVDTGECRTHG